MAFVDPVARLAAGDCSFFQNRFYTISLESCTVVF